MTVYRVEYYQHLVRNMENTHGCLYSWFECSCGYDSGMYLFDRTERNLDSVVHYRTHYPRYPKNVDRLDAPRRYVGSKFTPKPDSRMQLYRIWFYFLSDDRFVYVLARSKVHAAMQFASANVAIEWIETVPRLGWDGGEQIRVNGVVIAQ